MLGISELRRVDNCIDRSSKSLASVGCSSRREEGRDIPIYLTIFIERTYYREKTVYMTILLNLIKYELYMQRVWGFIPFIILYHL